MQLFHCCLTWKPSQRAPLPGMQRSITQTTDGQIRAPIRKLGSKSLINIHAMPRHLPWIHQATAESISVRKYLVGKCLMRHMLLNAEVRNAHIEMQRSSHAYGRQIGRAMAARLPAVQIGEACDATHMGDASGMNHGRSDVINQLLADQSLAVEDGVEYFTH